ncbi:hypothetical protein MOPEL_001_00220 [Mobilicoccus pelagius NBRC 104925]|uniref:ABC transporter ATP-binding protein n=1 Tax=Mobilicoccus pelagius NBRC 104925 TaxID=1089455 RepID=H5UME6_9MICO|nr:hypothetical protein MOPEL_001_00220 [Mobilicoccus pelagius NBRC 104925]
MEARLALGIALLTDPEVLVLDEPQNGLDPEGIIELRDLIRDLAARLALAVPVPVCRALGGLFTAAWTSALRRSVR